MNDLFANVDIADSNPIEMPDADVRFQQSFLQFTQADEMLSALIDQTEWQQEKVQVWGKWHMQPRLIAWHGDEGADYAYSGSRLKPKPWTPILLSLKSRVELASKSRFNSVLLNYYRDQNDSMGWHSDNEPELGRQPTIASVSLGDTRVFLFKHKVRKDLGIKKIPLSHGSLLVMAGDTQIFWQHAINRESKFAGSRVNLTFRLIGSN